MSDMNYCWDDLKNDLLSIVAQINTTEWMPDAIVGIKRGGLIPAVSISHYMNRPLYVVSCQLRDGENSVDLLDASRIQKDKRILVVDDICDSGDTFEKVLYAMKKLGQNDIKTCCIFQNIRQNFIANFKAKKIDREIDKRWIVFQWER